MKKFFIISLLLLPLLSYKYPAAEPEHRFRLLSSANAQLGSDLPKAEKIAFRRKAVHVMRDQLELTTKAVAAGEHIWARENLFIPAQKLWFRFGGTINRLDPAVYQPVQTEFAEVSRLIAQTNPEQAKLLEHLKALNDAVEQAVLINDANE